MSWYYAQGQEQVGPVEDAEFDRLVASGQIASHTLVWQPGMADWQPYGQVAATSESAPAAAPSYELPQQASPAVAGTGMQCVQCGRVFSESDLLEYQGNRVCAECKPIYFQRIREGVAPTMAYAGFWIRVGASTLDAVILWVFYAVLTAPFGFIARADNLDLFAMFAVMMSNLVYGSIAVLYGTWFIGRFGATPGKMAVGIKVVTSNGGPVSYLRALGRCFAKIISRLILCIGYIMAAFDDQKRALHDYICDTRVVRK